MNTANYFEFLLSGTIEDPRLKKLPFMVINTHNHFDHIGGNHCFSAKGKLLTPFLFPLQLSSQIGEIFSMLGIRALAVNRGLSGNQKRVNNACVDFGFFHTPTRIG